MTTIANVGADMLRAAANFFRAVGEENPALSEQMSQNATAYDNVAQLLETDPTKEVEAPPVA
jgi:hypothetical protein